MIYDFIFLGVVLVVKVSHANGQKCYNSQADFISDCNSKNGVVNGGRCFFLATSAGVNIRSNWTDAFELCKQQGGTLAQIHTSKEMAAVTAYLMGKQASIPELVWIAAARDASVTSGSYAIDLARTRWCDDNNQCSSTLIAANTYLRTHQKDDILQSEHACFNLWTNFTKFADYNCSYSDNVPLCTMYNAIQTFVYVPNKCMSEPIIDTYIVTDVAACATYCSHRVWCHSYNFYPETSKCDLFPWYHMDTPYVADVIGCYHYSYLP